MTYTGCNLEARANLRPAPFFPYAPCRIMEDMEKRRIYFKEWRKHRIAFGRNGKAGKTFYGAVLLSPEATAELKSQLESLRIG